jgi:hypothetical protein
LYSQYHRYLGVFAHLNGFKVSEVRINDRMRISGESKYGKSGIKRLYFLFDLFPLYFLVKGTRNITWFTGKVILLFTVLSTLCLLLSTIWYAFLPLGIIFISVMLSLMMHTVIELLYYMSFQSGYEQTNNTYKHRIFSAVRFELIG